MCEKWVIKSAAIVMIPLVIKGLVESIEIKKIAKNKSLQPVLRLYEPFVVILRRGCTAFQRVSL